jgi:hypothetical protein
MRDTSARLLDDLAVEKLVFLGLTTLEREIVVN